MLPKLPSRRHALRLLVLSGSDVPIAHQFQVNDPAFFLLPFRLSSLNLSCHFRLIQEEVPCDRRSKKDGWLFSCRSDRGNMILTPRVIR